MLVYSDPKYVIESSEAAGVLFAKLSSVRIAVKSGAANASLVNEARNFLIACGQFEQGRFDSGLDNRNAVAAH